MRRLENADYMADECSAGVNRMLVAAAVGTVMFADFESLWGLEKSSRSCSCLISAQRRAGLMTWVWRSEIW